MHGLVYRQNSFVSNLAKPISKSDLIAIPLSSQYQHQYLLTKHQNKSQIKKVDLILKMKLHKINDSP